jgi:hypothetical protein
MAIDTYDKLIAAVQHAQSATLSKASLATQLAGGLTSLWRATGNPAQGAIPAAAAVCTKSTVGGWPFINPTAGQKTNLCALSISGSISHQFRIYDRLAHMGGLNGTVATAQTVGLTIPPNRGAAVDGSNVKWFLEIYTAIGVTGVSGTLTYVDGTDVTRTVAVTIGGASPANQPSRVFDIIPNAGQTIKSITSFIHATTGTAGSYGFTCAKFLTAQAMGQPNIGVSLDFAQLAAPEVPDDACLWFVLSSSSTSSGTIAGSLALMQG